MNQWLIDVENWLARQYRDTLDIDIKTGPVRLRWLQKTSLSSEVAKANSHNLCVEDSDVGWLVFVLPFEPELLQTQINQALGLRSRLLREANYTGSDKAGPKEDREGSWRISLIWLVAETRWIDWQLHIQEIRRESGVAEELSFDVIRFAKDEVASALDKHGLPRLLFNTRALLKQTANQAERWLSADVQVLSELDNFSQRFDSPSSRTFARELEEKAKAFQPKAVGVSLPELRRFRKFSIKNFRNLDSLEVAADETAETIAQAIVLYGPNGTGKSSFVEALSLAAFGTSPRLEQFLTDKDLPRSSADAYLKEYVAPLDRVNDPKFFPSYVWDKGKDTPFALTPGDDSKRRFEGVVLNQEDSLKFTDLTRQELASLVLKGYSALADHLAEWLANEERRASDVKQTFTRKHGINASIKLSSTAYDRLASGLLSQQLERPSPEFLDWLSFLSRFNDDDSRSAEKLLSEWSNLQATAVTRLAQALAKFQELGASQAQLALSIQERLGEFDKLAEQSRSLRQRLETRNVPIRDVLETALSQIETWGAWLVSLDSSPQANNVDGKSIETEIEILAKRRTEIEKLGKELRARLGLLDQTKAFLKEHWTGDHRDTCPVCDSDVADRQGIEQIVSTLQDQTNALVQQLRAQFVEIQSQQKDLDTRLKALGLSTCPIAPEDQARLRGMLSRFMPDGAILEEWLKDIQRRSQLRNDLARMKASPDAPKSYADTPLESDRLAKAFMALAQEADRALEDPQSIGEVKKVFEQRLEKVLKSHLPSTLGKVWRELTMTLTTASWLLPVQPALTVEGRGGALSVKAEDTDRFIRYIFNAAERHVLGLAWFFTYYFAKKRFEEAWVLLDDPAQEMDQPSYRELVRLWETLVRVHQKASRPLTIIVALHQEERALDAARATNGRLYVLGWQKKQEDSSNRPSVRKVVLLAPGFHPLKPEAMYSE